MQLQINLPVVNRTEGHLDLFYCGNIGLYRLTLCEPKYKSKAAWLSTVIIDEKYRGEGHGNKLLEHAEEQANKWGCTALSLEVEWRSWVRDWYERKGFVVVAEGIEDSMVVMTKIL